MGGAEETKASHGIKNKEELAKSRLALLIKSAIKEHNLTQKQAAKIMHIDQPSVSKITCGLLSAFSLQRLKKALDFIKGP